MKFCRVMEGLQPYEDGIVRWYLTFMTFDYYVMLVLWGVKRQKACVLFFPAGIHHIFNLKETVHPKWKCFFSFIYSTYLMTSLFATNN